LNTKSEAILVKNRHVIAYINSQGILTFCRSSSNASRDDISDIFISDIGRYISHMTIYQPNWSKMISGKILLLLYRFG